LSPVDRQRWQALSPHLDKALEMEGDERAAWLDSLRAEDPRLAAELEALLEERSALSQERFLEGDSPLRPAASSLAGQSFGAYTLVSPIGQGGMGSVWLARRSDGRYEGPAAVKLLSPELVGGGGERRFRREGSLLARLSHPHIARLLDAGLSPIGQPYLVLEYVEGEPIDRHCDRVGLSVEGRLRLFLDVLDAVAHAHVNLVVHRDIKPSNVMVSTAGQVKLLDFGIAKLLEGDGEPGQATALTRDAGRALTPEYAAPEQVTGEPVTTATDVYALGGLLYLLLSGRHPAGAARRSPVELLKAIVETEPQRLSAAVTDARTQTTQTLAESAARRSTTPDHLRRQLRGDLETIVVKAMKKRPQERYASASALAEDVRRFLERRPITARPDTLAYRTARFLRRNARGVTAVSAAAVALVAVVAFYTARLATERDRARLEARKAEQVSEFLTGLFTSADPYARETSEPTVRGILDAGAAKVRQQLGGQPELQAEMLTLMGRIYERLGDRERAMPLLQEAVAAARRLFGPSPRLAQGLNDLGVLLAEKGDLAAAEPLLEEALGLRRKLLGDENPEVAVTLVELGRVYSDRGLLERAEPLFRDSLAIRRKALGPQHKETATSLSDLGLLLRQKGDLAGAETLLREALEISRKVFHEDHPNVATALGNVALCLGERGDYAGSAAMLREALAINRKIWPANHLNIAGMLSNYSNVLREQGEIEAAARAAEEALQIARPAFGTDDPALARYLVSLGRVRLAQGKAAAAEPLLRQALAQRERSLPADDWRLAATRSQLGASLTALGLHEEAERLLLAAAAGLKDVPGAQGREFKANRARLVALYEALGRPEKAAVYRAAQP